MDSNVLQDDEIIQRVRSGDYQAFGQLVQRYQATIYHLCYRVAGHPQEAEDLAHEAFVEAYLKLDQLRDPGRFQGWMRTLALNMCRMWYRAQKRRASEDVLLIHHTRATQDDDTEKAHRQIIHSLSKLSLQHRLPLVLHYWEGLSYEQIAAFLEIPMGTVMSRLHRARQALRRHMDAVMEEEIPMTPDETFQEEIEAEITLLLRAFDPKAEERLSVILGHSPHRLLECLEHADDPNLEENLATLWRRLHTPGMDLVVNAALAGQEPLCSRATDLLIRWLTRHTQYAQGPAREVHVLLDELIRHPASDRRKAALLVQLLGVCSEGDAIPLLTSVLLCYPDEALPQLLDRFWSANDADALYQPAHVLHALCRLGTRFGQAVLQVLATADEAAQALAFAGLDALVRAVEVDWLRDASPEELAMEARFRKNLGPPPLAYRDELILGRIKEAAADVLDHPNPGIREPALRILGRMRAVEYVDQITAQVSHADASTRQAAILALSEMGDPRCAEALMHAARTGKTGERRAAIEVLGRLKATQAQEVLLGFLDDPQSRIRQATVLALGDIDPEGNRPLLTKLTRSSDRVTAKAAAKALYAKHEYRKPSETTRKRLQKIRGDESPVAYVSTEVAVRTLPEIRAYDEKSLTRLIAQVCHDYSTTRRFLVMEGQRSLMNRADGTYEFTELGKAVWRVEHFIMDHSPVPAHESSVH